jgi:uncharacterized protein (DUF2267 family)
MEPLITHLEKSEWKLLRTLKKEWSLANYRLGVAYLSKVMQALRQGLSQQQVNQLVNRLPDFLKLAFISDWKMKERKKKLRYVDELVQWVVEKDKQSPQRLFKSELHALTVVVFVLKYLDTMTGLSDLPGLRWEFKQELEKIELGEVA